MSEPVLPPPRRSCLSVPGSDQHKLSRAWSSGADELVFDLEDAVAPACKDDARRIVVSALAEARSRGARVAVRVNAPRTRWCHQDVEAVVACPTPPASIVVPKVEGAGDLAFVDRLVAGVQSGTGATEHVGLQALIESARGVARVAEVATATPRLDTLVLGYADLAASLGWVDTTQHPADWTAIQTMLVVAGRGNDVQVIDGPFLGVNVDDAFHRVVRRCVQLGFDGKWVIHPRQVDAVNQAFTPSEQEVASARAVLRALSDAVERDGAGAAVMDGMMVDEASAAAARRVLARAQALRP